ncbi:FKBP-type peptidyl-prolyl cis-trans isomerase [Klebsiella michiganensis]|uniref:FKBP-type peptidyl-prolyl cis-trans isomerase n=1 Tax=Klebsiella michiganensis TaxID=1134687 RepID=UPI0032EF769D
MVPPEKAYGDEGLPPKVPPGATLVYRVRIVDAQPAAPGDPAPAATPTGKRPEGVPGRAPRPAGCQFDGCYS